MLLVTDERGRTHDLASLLAADLNGPSPAKKPAAASGPDLDDTDLHLGPAPGGDQASAAGAAETEASAESCEWQCDLSGPFVNVTYTSPRFN